MIRDSIEKIMEKHTKALTKTGDKDFNPPEVVLFDAVVLDRYEATNELVSLFKKTLREVVGGDEKPDDYIAKHLTKTERSIEAKIVIFSYALQLAVEFHARKTLRKELLEKIEKL